MKTNDVVATGLLAFPLAIAALAMGGFACNVPIGMWQMPFGLAIALGTVCFMAEKGGRARAVAWTIAVIAGSIFLSGLSVGYTTADAARYYRPGTILLASGWNPLVHTEVDQVSQMTGGGCAAWPIAFLPRLSWIFGAACCRWFGFVEIADAFNVIMLVASFLVAGSWLKERFGLDGLGGFALTIVLCLSPHVVVGLFGGSFDAGGYSAFLVAIAAADRKQYVPLVLASLAMGGLKFTGCVFAALVFAVALAFDLKNWRKTVAVGALSGVLILLLNASPYLTSLKNHGGPFYPSHSFIASERFPDDKNPITSDIGYMNADAGELGYFGRFGWAYVSQNLVKAYYRHKTGREDFSPDFHVNGGIEGFGRIFRLLFVLSVLGWPFVRSRHIHAALCMILLSVLIQPTYYSGIARYVPQFWLFPWLVALGLTERFGSCRNFRYFKWPCWGGLALYGVGSLAYPLSFFALQWIVSVQTIQIATAAADDRSAVGVVEKSYRIAGFYEKAACATDIGLPKERIFDNLEDANVAGLHEYSTYFKYGSCFLSREIADFHRLNHVAALNDQSVKESRNSANIRFFLREFLPYELPRIPIRIWQAVCLRASQFCRWREHDININTIQ